MSGTDFKLFINGNDLSSELETTIIETCNSTRIKCVCNYEEEDFKEIHTLLKSKKKITAEIINSKTRQKVISQSGFITYLEHIFPIDTEQFKFYITL